MKKIRVGFDSNSYDIRIGSGALKKAGLWLKELGFSDKLVIVTDPTVKSLYGNSLKQSLTRGGFKVSILEVPEGEEQKSLESAGRLYNELTDLYAERTTPIIAVGGGVIGDLAGFVAATYLRGVPLVQIPTTLLAQVDSSIGGKVAVNYGRLKNRIGAFYQPRLVISDMATLKTLPAAELSDGLAEVIKYGVIKDSELFNYIEQNLDQIKSLDDKALETIVYRSAKIKAEVVEKDEKDFGLRQILNYGHTVGHAIETVSGFKMRHGQAVAVGMMIAARISNKLGMLDKKSLARLKNVIVKAGLPVDMQGFDQDGLIKAMKHDKKVSQGKLNFVLPKSIGEVLIKDDVGLTIIEEALSG
ncbi:MAG: 3-dehydroquinate synthase [Chloroflexota bacterium]